MTQNAVDKVKDQASKTKLQPVEVMIKNSVKALGESLPAHMNPERMVRIALTTMRLNPALYECTPESFMGALFQSAQLGLEPNVEGQAYILPFNNRRKIGNDWKTFKEAQFVIGYKGLIDLFYRHGAAVSIDFQKVKGGDEFDFQYGTESYLHHKPAGDKKDVRSYYAVAKLKGGGTIFHVMTKDECIEHGKSHSKCVDKDGNFYKNTPWATELDAMCLKTVLIQLMKKLPKSIELQRAISADGTIKTSVNRDMFEVKNEANWDDAEFAENGTSEPRSEKSRQGSGKDAKSAKNGHSVELNNNSDAFLKKPSEVREDAEGRVIE